MEDNSFIIVIALQSSLNLNYYRSDSLSFKKKKGHFKKIFKKTWKFQILLKFLHKENIYIYILHYITKH